MPIARCFLVDVYKRQLQQHMQLLRGALAGLGVEREVASHFFLAVHPLLFSEEYDVFLEMCIRDR